MRVIITGAAGGIGAAVARGLASGDPIARPHRMLLVGRDRAGLAETVRHIGPSATACVADLSDPHCGDTIVAAAVATMGGIDGLVSNAGIVEPAPLADLAVEAFDRTIAVNVRATWLIAKAAYPHLREAGGGAVVATASVSATQPTPSLGAYSASKAALVMLVRQMANEWGPDGIRCNTVSPGPTLTPMTAVRYGNTERRSRREADLPLRRLAEAKDIASVILFLLSDAARNVTGIDLATDGGLGTTLMASIGSGTGKARH